MPHFQTWDSTYYDFSGAEPSNQAHRATAHRRWEPVSIGDQDAPADSFEFEEIETPGPSDPSSFEFIDNQAEVLTFAPLVDQSDPVSADDHCSSDEHEVEFDVVAGV